MAMVLTGLLLKIAMIATIVVAASVVVERLRTRPLAPFVPAKAGIQNKNFALEKETTGFPQRRAKARRPF